MESPVGEREEGGRGREEGGRREGGGREEGEGRERGGREEGERRERGGRRGSGRKEKGGREGGREGSRQKEEGKERRREEVYTIIQVLCLHFGMFKINIYKVDRQADRQTATQTDRRTDRQTDTPGRGGVPGFPPKVITGTDLRLDKVEGEGIPISVRSSADPYFFCCGEGREERMTSWSYTVRMVTGVRRRGEERRLVKQGSLEGSGTCLDIFKGFYIF